MLTPRKPVPNLTVKLVGGEQWELSSEKPKHFTLLVFYRGMHCPICRKYLTQLESLLPEFHSRGVKVVALSSDELQRATKTKTDWKLAQLPLGYGVSIATGREWGLFVSTSRGKTSLGIEEPALFIEPGLFLVRPDGTLYASVVQTMPFARPDFQAMLTSLDFILEKDYPARGEA